MSAFSGIDKATSFDSAPWLEPGQFKLKITELKLDKSTDPLKRGKEYFIANFEILESTHEKLPAGGPVCWIVGMDLLPALGNVKAFAAVVLDCEDSEIDEQIMLNLVGPKQPAAGIVLKANAFEITTRQGNPFTKIRWDAA